MPQPHYVRLKSHTLGLGGWMGPRFNKFFWILLTVTVRTTVQMNRSCMIPTTWELASARVHHGSRCTSGSATALAALTRLSTEAPLTTTSGLSTEGCRCRGPLFI